jgi:hypothetical protein
MAGTLDRAVTSVATQLMLATACTADEVSGISRGPRRSHDERSLSTLPIVYQCPRSLRTNVLGFSENAAKLGCHKHTRQALAPKC